MKIPLTNATIDYDEHFIDKANAPAYFNALHNEIAWRQDFIVMFGKKTPLPRLQAWHGDEGVRYQYSNISLCALPWTPLLLQLKRLVSAHCHHDFNAVLINLYRDQRDSVGWHSDNETALGTQPVIASLSLGAERDFSLKHLFTNERFKLTLASGSLLVMSGQTQRYWQHCLPKRSKAALPRINLTFRKIVNQVGN